MNLRKNENSIAFIIVASVLILVSFLWFAFKNPSINPRLEKENYTIIHKWEMPKELDEISGISWVSEDKLACVQDEEGIIFIYNLKKSEVEKKINFAKSGDYEGIAIADSTAYVLRSDGVLFEVNNYLSDDFTVETYVTPFSGKNNMESLTFDSKNNRLLIVPKNKDLDADDYLGIYVFNLETKKLQEKPIFQINFDDPIFENNSKKKGSKKIINPSDIAIHPKTGNHYILEGKNPQLLILDPQGKPLEIYNLLKKSFNQAEGIIFSPEGTMYIGNEGKKGTANILEVTLDKK